MYTWTPEIKKITKNLLQKIMTRNLVNSGLFQDFKDQEKNSGLSGLATNPR